MVTPVTPEWESQVRSLHRPLSLLALSLVAAAAWWNLLNLLAYFAGKLYRRHRGASELLDADIPLVGVA